MAFSLENRKGTVSGIIFVAIFASTATYIATLAPVKALGLSPLVIGIVIGIIYANTIHNITPDGWDRGVVFSAKKILRFAIVIYGFRITFQQIAEVGMEGFLVSIIMLSTTFIIGSWLGYKIFDMERDTAMLTASGASVCGAAAVLATEPVLKAEGHKTAIAVWVGNSLELFLLMVSISRVLILQQFIWNPRLTGNFLNHYWTTLGGRLGILLVGGNQIPIGGLAQG